MDDGGFRLAKVHDDLLGEARAFLEAICEVPLPDFLAAVDWAMPERRLAPRPLPCLGYLPAAAAIAGMCNSRFVDPPNAACTSMAFSIAASVRI